MEQTVDVRATPTEVIDLAIRVIDYHSGEVAEHNETTAVGIFGKRGFLGSKDVTELRVGTISLDYESTRVQLACGEGPPADAAKTLLEGLGPHIIETTTGQAHGTPLVPRAEPEPLPPHDPTAGVFCTQCGFALPSADTSFCTQCGAQVSLNQDAPITTHVPPADTPFQDDDKTIVAEDDDDEGVSAEEVLADDPSIGNEYAGTPGWEIATVVDEPEPPVAEGRLVLDGHPDVKLALLAGEEFLAGRDIRVASWVPEDPRISRRHFRISVHESGFVIEDLASSNGTYLNGAYVREPQPLVDGDVIEVGHLRAVFRVDEAPWTESQQ